MSETLAQAVERPATLELEDGTRLAGDLSGQSDGRVRLTSTRIIRKPTSGKKPLMQPGATAELQLSPTESSTVAASCSVTIIAEEPGGLVLEFNDTEDETAQSFREDLETVPAPEAPADVVARYPEILDSLKAQSLSQLDYLLTPFLSDLANYLFDLSTQVKHSSSDKNVFYDATVDIRRHTGKIATDTIRQLEQLYGDLLPKKKAKKKDSRAQGEPETGNLGLVDTAEYESSLAVDRMIRRGEDIYRIPLEALLIRLSILIGANPNKVRLPVHVRQLSNAFETAVKAQQYASPVLLRIFDYFSREFMRNLDAYYMLLNRDLAQQGVWPGLEAEITEKGSLLKQARPPRPVIRNSPIPRGPAEAGKQAPAKAADDGSSATLADIATTLQGQPAGTAMSPPAQHGKYDNIYKSVIDALNFRRSADESASGDAGAFDTPAAGGNWDGTTLSAKEAGKKSLANAQDIARALGSIQHNAKIRAAVEQGSSLREYLANNKQDLGNLRDTAGLTADSLNQLDLVDNLFGTIKSQLDVATELRPALGNLHIPMGKLALLDPHFFLDRGHPARTTLDKLAQLSTSANFPNKALEGRIGEIVDQIVTNYDDDNSVFDSALEKIDKLVAQQERALSRNVERVVRIEEGQEKLHRAQASVDKVIGAKVRTAKAPKVLVDLIENGWRDLLVLTQVKEGPHSKAWKEHIKTLDQLGLWLREQDQSETNEDLVLQRGLEAGTMIDMLEQQIAQGLPTNVSHQPILDQLRGIVAGTQDVEFIDCTADAGTALPEAGDIRAKIEDLPRLRRWVQRVEQLEKDSWLSYRDKKGQKVRMQLAWVSEERDRFIFVNERGQKIADLSAIQLARQLSRGMQPPAPADKLSIVDKSLYQTLEHVQKTLSFARNHDSLTKLINRDTFLDQMGRALRHAQQKRSQHAVLYLNIDQFNLVNDVYDKVHGDQVLLEFARLLAQMHGKKSSSARIEADSFAVLLLDRTAEQAMQIAEKIRRDIEASSVDIDGEKIGFTVSIGAVPILEHSPEVGKILSTARDTMHHAKEQGRNRVVQYVDDQRTASTYTLEKMRARKDLEQAVATDRFVLRAQPIVQTTVTGDIVENLHFELLLAISNKDGSLSSPQEFIVSAERYGFMSLVDRWVVKETFSWISQLMDAQKVVPSLSINLSGTSVTDDGFMDYLFEQISEYGVGTSRICFEITETGTISNLVKAADFVRAFRNIGCKFSIDDFGTGLASHNYLRELPVDYVKIDGSFITGIHKNRNDYAIARSINDLAHFLGQETIAECVENEQIIVKLREIGVDYLQGWGIGKPKLLSEVTEDLSAIEK